MSQRTPEEVAAGALHERECPAPIHWEETRRSIISRFAAAIARERETAEKRIGQLEKEIEGYSDVARALAGASGKIIDCTGPEPRVLPMAPRADGSPSTLMVTADGYVVGEGVEYWPTVFGGVFYVTMWSPAKPTVTLGSSLVFAVRANASAAAKGGRVSMDSGIAGTISDRTLAQAFIVTATILAEVKLSETDRAAMVALLDKLNQEAEGFAVEVGSRLSDSFTGAGRLAKRAIEGKWGGR